MFTPFDVIYDVFILLCALGTVAGLLFPRYTLYAWWRRRKLPHFKSAARLLEHLESVSPMFGEFEYDKKDKTFHYGVGKPGDYGYAQEFTTTTKLRDAIIQNLQPNRKPWHNMSRFPSYQVEDLLPLARIEKLKLLVG